MAIEIQILSGTQQGRSLRFEGDRILVGDVAVADVRFDPNRESGARGKNAVITLDDEAGWQLSNIGAGVWLVNQTPVESSQTHRTAVGRPGAGVGSRAGLLVSHRCRPATLRNSRDGRAASGAGQLAAAPSPVHGNEAEQAPAAARPEPLTSEAAEAEAIAAYPAPRTPRRKRERSALGRLIGIVGSALLGLACAYALACWVDKKNDIFHVVDRLAAWRASLAPNDAGVNATSPPAPLPQAGEGRDSPSPPGSLLQNDPNKIPSPPAPLLPTAEQSEGEGRNLPSR